MGTATAFDLLPSEKLGVVILTNGTPTGIPETMAKEFYDIVEMKNHGAAPNVLNDGMRLKISP